MAFKGQTGIRFGHATAVIDNLNGRTSGVDHQYIDGMGTGIDGVLDQLFDDRGRALYHLAGSYLVSHAVRKKLYYVSHGLGCWLLAVGGWLQLCSWEPRDVSVPSSPCPHSWDAS